LRLRHLLIIVLALVALLPLAGCGRTTPTEAAAIAAARSDPTAYTLPPDKLAKSTRIWRFYNTMEFVVPVWGMVSLFLVLQLGVAARMRDAAARLSRKRLVQWLVFLFELLLLESVLNLPLNMLAHHASVANGFSIQPLGGWFADLAKSFAIAYLTGGVFVLLIVLLMRKFPRRWWLALWAPTMAMVICGVFLTPLVFDPLYYNFEPLSQSNPALVAQIERVAAHGGIDIPPERMFLMKASEKTTLMNAYVTGFGSSKRLVIWDTLLKKAASPEVILFTAGHEMGHYVLGHIVRGILMVFAGILLAFFVGFHLFQFLLHRFFPRWKIPSQQDAAALALILLVYHVILFFAEPIRNTFSRGMEHDADVFGQEAIHGVVADPQATALAEFRMFGEATFDEPNPSEFVEFWMDSHPSTAFRAAFAKHYDPWVPGEEPKYFRK
jgi:Zn-dependent protease with chaperone function